MKTDQATLTTTASPAAAGVFPAVRLRRLRANPALRNLLQQHQVTVQDLVLPLFIKSGKGIKQPIQSMPGHFQLSVDQLPAEIAAIKKLHIPAVILFGIPATKDSLGSSALSAEGVVQTATKVIKDLAPELLVISDLCFCEYTDHGHCGVLTQNSMGQLDVDNDATLAHLAQQAVSHARAGVDIIAPSGMMDGAVASIRQALDQTGFHHLPILSYAVKYASSFYGPFREAAGGAPQPGSDRRGYQMDPAAGGALREAELDLQEGADILMVKPAHTYLDILQRLKVRFPEVPLAAYHVSGEYAMIKAAAKQGLLDEHAAMLETLVAIKRAGADFIISYYAKEFAILNANR